jgi:hypothetical protein
VPNGTRKSRHQFVSQPDQTVADPLVGYSAWQFSDSTTPDPSSLPSNTAYPDTPPRDDRPTDDSACRVEPDSRFNYDLERQDPPSFDVERDNSCSTDSSSDSGDSGGDNSSDSSSSD